MSNPLTLFLFNLWKGSGVSVLSLGPPDSRVCESAPYVWVFSEEVLQERPERVSRVSRDTRHYNTR